MTAPPRLLAVTGSGEFSGAERVLVGVLAEAHRQGWPVACAAPAGPLAQQLADADVEVVALPALGLGAGPRPWAAVLTAGRWLRAAARVRRAAATADVVLLNSLTALPVARLARLRTPTAWLAHDVVVRPDRLRLLRLCRTAIRLVVAVSEAVAVPVRASGLRTTVVHNGVPWPVDPAPDPGRRIVGINGLLTPWKGHQVLLDAVELLPDDVTVEMMGGVLPKDTDHAAALRRRAEGLGDRVAVLGHVADPQARMRTWTVAVSASVEPEACPLNVLEAMSLGIPVVASDHGGAPEVLAGSGRLVPPGDPAALAAAIVRLLDDPGERRRCAEAGRRRVATAHQWDVQVARLLDVLAAEAAA